MQSVKLAGALLSACLLRVSALYPGGHFLRKVMKI